MINRGQLFVLGLIFLASFAIAAIAMIVTYINNEIYADSLTTLIVKLTVIYSAPLGVIVGGIFGKMNITKHQRSDKVTLFGSAVIFSGIWNALILWRVLAFAFSENDANDAVISYFNSLMPYTTFLIGGALSYFVSREN